MSQDPIPPDGLFTEGTPQDSQRPDTFLIQEAYANIYNEIVQPDKVFVATQYFRQKWVPLLGPSLAWVILALRQHCYWNRQTGEMRNWCLITQEELAREVGVTEATVRRLFKQEYADRFIIDVSHRYRYDASLGKQVRKQSMYQVRMDDPLVDEDAILLRERVAEQLQGLRQDPETGQINALHLLDRFTSMQLDDLPIKMIGRSATDTRNGDRGGSLPEASPLPTEGAALPYPSARFLTPDQLPAYTLAEDQVLVEWDEGYLAVPLKDVIKRDLEQDGDLFGFTQRTQCYYSVSHALGEGGDAWSPEEEQKLALEHRLIDELKVAYRRLGAFSLEDGLSVYFSPQLVATLLQDRTPVDRQRIEDWLAYVRQNQNLKNPAGFLRTRIEGDEYPPGF